MSTEFSETVYHYAVRDPAGYMPDPRVIVPKRVLQEWDILFIIQSFQVRHNGHIYVPVPDADGIKQLYYVHHIPFADYDMLDAFGVWAVTGFEPKYWYKPLGT